MSYNFFSRFDNGMRILKIIQKVEKLGMMNEIEKVKFLRAWDVMKLMILSLN
jgi:hypothetical protein